MRRYALILVILTLVSCGGGTASSQGAGGPLTGSKSPEDLKVESAPAENPSSREAQTMGQLATYVDGAYFVRWTETGEDTTTSLSGVLYMASLSDDGQRVETEQVSFTGTRSSGDITMTFEQGFGFSTSIVGTLEYGNLTLFLPADDGSLQPAFFAAGSVEEYNAAVADLQAESAAHVASAQVWEAAEDEVRQTTANLKRRLSDIEGALYWAEVQADTVHNVTLQVLSDNVEWMEENVELAETDSYYADVVIQDLEVVEQDWSSVQEDLSLLRGDEGVGEVERLLPGLAPLVADLEDALEGFEQTTGVDGLTQFPDARSALADAAAAPSDVDGRLAAIRSDAEQVESEAQELTECARDLAETFR